LKEHTSFGKPFLAKIQDLLGLEISLPVTLILSDSFLVDPLSDVLEVMFQLEKVSATWTEKLTTESSEAGELEFVPAYANHHVLILAEAHSIPNAQPSIFFFPWQGITSTLKIERFGSRPYAKGCRPTKA
jgi:hypothetical protein